MSLSDISVRLGRAVEAAGRPTGSVKLIAISKVQPLGRVRAVLESGHRIFGENRVQEAGEKWPDFKAEFDPADRAARETAQPGKIELHLVGPLQSNKLNRALELFDAIHSLDRDSLARKLSKAVQSRGSCPEIFIQVNTGREAQKSGIDPDFLDAFVETCQRSYDLPIRGLMVIPPVDDAPETHFRQLADLARRNGLDGLSMGMSGDFETAIACGATHVRVGSAIFGARKTGP